MATFRPSRESRARYTLPMPHAPTGATIWCGSSLVPLESATVPPHAGQFYPVLKLPDSISYRQQRIAAISSHPADLLCLETMWFRPRKLALGQHRNINYLVTELRRRF
jgi:hypothetical protein